MRPKAQESNLISGVSRRTMETMLGKHRLWGVLLILGSSTIFQLGSATATILFDHIGPLSTAFVRQLIAGFLLFALTRPQIHRWNKQQWRYVVAFGVVLGIMNNFFYLAIDRIPLGVAVTIEFLGPLALAAILSHGFRDILWVSLALIGILLFGAEGILGNTALDPVGMIFALVAATGWALYILIAAKVGEHVPGTGGLAIALLIASSLLAPFGCLGALPVLYDAHLLLLATLTALLASLIPFTFEFFALKRVPSKTFSVLMSLEPAIAAAIGIIVLHQPLSIYSAIAMSCVIAAAFGSALCLPATRLARKNEPKVLPSGSSSGQNNRI